MTLTVHEGSYKPTRTFGSAPKCPRCEKSVYAAEAVQGPASKTYHKFCLKCTNCNKTLDALALLEHEGEPFCKPCHSSLFGPKGYGFGGSMSGDYIDRLTGTPSPRRPTSSYTSPTASPSRAFYSSPTKTPASPIRRSIDDDRTRRTHEPMQTASPGSGSARPLPTPPASSPFQKVNANVNKPMTSDQDACKRCGQVVYFAERALAAGNKWHKRCLRCAKCSKTLDSHLLVKGDLPFCKKCASEENGLGAMGIMTRPNLY